MRYAWGLDSRNEYFVCIDGDALLDPRAVSWMVLHLTSGPRVGAVTGNPRIRNRSTLLGRLQVGEFSSIIGMIKRALCYILMPETLKGLWKQRLRWAQGGVEVLLQHTTGMLHWRARRMWGVVLEFICSVIWAYVVSTMILLWLVGMVVPLPAPFHISPLIPRWHGVAMGLLCLLQFAVSHWIDRRYEPGVWRNFFWMIWYPFAYWMINMMTMVVAFPKAALRRKGARAIWESPDRGYR